MRYCACGIVFQTFKCKICIFFRVWCIFWIRLFISLPSLYYAGLYSGLFCYLKRLARTQSLIKLQNSVLIAKPFQTLQKPFEWVFFNKYIPISSSTKVLLISQKLFKIVRQLNFLSAKGFAHHYTSFSIWGGEHILFHALFVFCFAYTYFSHSKNFIVSIKAYTKILPNKYATLLCVYIQKITAKSILSS